MLDWTLVVLTICAMVIDSLAIAFLFWIMSRTKGRFRLSFIFLIIAMFLLLIRRTFNLLNLSAIFQSDYVDNILAVATAFSLLMAIINFFKSIKEITDVEVDEYRKEEHFRPQQRRPEKREIVHYHKPEIRPQIKAYFKSPETVSELIDEVKRKKEISEQ